MTWCYMLAMSLESYQSPASVLMLGEVAVCVGY